MIKRSFRRIFPITMKYTGITSCIQALRMSNTLMPAVSRKLGIKRYNYHIITTGFCQTFGTLLRYMPVMLQARGINPFGAPIIVFPLPSRPKKRADTLLLQVLSALIIHQAHRRHTNEAALSAAPGSSCTAGAKVAGELRKKNAAN